FSGARPRRPSAQRARLDPAPNAEERRGGDGAVRPPLRLPEGARALPRARELKVWDAAHAAPKATLKDVADQIDYVKRIAGADHVGIGSDFDGVDDDLPVGLEDQSKYPMLFAELIA